MLPNDLKERICASSTRGQDPDLVDEALTELRVVLPEDALEFYRLFLGPIGTETLGYQLLDMVNDNPSVKSATQMIRKRFGLPDEWLVISDLLAGGLLIFNTVTNKVYDIDFEGSLEQVISGHASPTWASFSELLEIFFPNYVQ